MRPVILDPPRVVVGCWFVCMAMIVCGGTATFAESTPGDPTGPYTGFGYEWENNTLGEQEVVPEPWTPIGYGPRQLACWGRTYRLGRAALPAQISSQGHDLFAAAPKISLTVQGEQPLNRADAMVWSTRTPTRAVGRSNYQNEQYQIELTASLEYDGFYRVDLTISPKVPVRIDRLVATFPFRSSVATQFTRYLKYDFDKQITNRFEFPKSMGSITKAMHWGFVPSVWIGNHDVGAEWSCQTNAGWSNPPGSAVIDLVPDRDNVLLRINVITRPVTIEAPFTLSFALYPTPVKKLPDDARDYHLLKSWHTGPVIDAHRQKVFGVGWMDEFPRQYYGLPLLTAATNPKLLKKWPTTQPGLAAQNVWARKQVADAGVRFVPYGALYLMPAGLPDHEWKDYARYWRTGVYKNPNWSMLANLSKSESGGYYTDISPKSYRDFLIWQYVTAIEKDHLQGAYLDIAAPPRMCRNPLHPHTKDVGSDVLYYPFFWQRQFMKRLYVAAKSRDPNFAIIIHSSKEPVVASGFADMVLGGEALNTFFRSDHWTLHNNNDDPTAYVPDYSMLPDDFFTIGYTQNNGYINVLLPQVIKWNGQLMKQRPDLLQKYTRTLLARVVAYGIPLYRSRMDLQMYDQIMKVYRDFGGLAQTICLPPWKSAQVVGPKRRTLDMTVYLKPDRNAVLLAVANLTDQTISESLTLNHQALRQAGLSLEKSVRLVDAITGSAIAPVDGVYQLELASNDYRLLLCSPKQPARGNSR